MREHPQSPIGDSPLINRGQNHSILSASASHRWLHCPPSARLETAYPDQSSEYAKEGTLAHSLAETELRYLFGEIKLQEYLLKKSEIEADPLYSEAMPQYVQSYIDSVSSEIDYLCEKYGKENVRAYVEYKVDFSAYAPEGFGTADCLVCFPEGFLVFDLKYGQGVKVEAWDNPQLKLYGLGILAEQELVWGKNPVTCYICQPRLEITSVASYKYEELKKWGEEIKPLADLAYRGQGIMEIGSWCRFCKHRLNCERQREEALSVVALPEPQALRMEALVELLNKKEAIMSYLKDLEQLALEKVRDHGEQIPGYKLVAGRTVRKYGDPEAVASALLKAGYASSAIYKKPELLGIGDMEKLITKPVFKELLGDLVIKPEGAPTLVPVSDRRPEITNDAALAFENVKIGE